MLPLVARMAQGVDRSHWVSKIASRIGVREDALWEDLKRVRVSTYAGTQHSSATERKEISQKTRLEVLEERLLGMKLAYPQTAAANAYAFSRPEYQAPSADLTRRLQFEAEMLVSEDVVAGEIAICLHELERERVKVQLEQLTHDIRRAENVGNAQQVATLVREFNDVTRQLTK